MNDSLVGELKDAFVKSRQIKCFSCGKYKEKDEFPKLRYANSRTRYHCGYCLTHPRYVGDDSWYVDSETDDIKTYQSVELSTSDRNKLLAFVKNPTSYATGSDTAKQKVEYLVASVRSKLIGSELISFDLARQKYLKTITEKNNETPPNCPDCSSKMAKRSGRYGTFWGCTRYPLCRGTKNIHWTRPRK